MAIAYFAGNRWTGTSSDRAGITTGNIVAGLTFLETNTDDLYQWDGDSWNVIAGNTVVQTLDNKTLTSPVLTTPQINDSASDHQYVFAAGNLAADRTVALPVLVSNDTFVFNSNSATLINKTIDSSNNSISNIVNADLSGSAGITNANLATPTIVMAAEAGSNDGVALGETFTFTAGEGINTTMGSNAVTIAGEDASASNKGVASFSSNDFSVSSGAVTIKSGGVTSDQLAGSVANGKLSGPALAVTDGSTSSNIAPGGTLTFAATANETTIAQSGGTVTVGLPSNVIIAGTLTVNGSTTLVNSTVVTIDDPIFTLGGDTAPGSDDNKDRGIEFRWHNGSAAKVGFFGFDDSTGKFTFIPDATNSSEVMSGTAGTIVATTFEGALTGNVTGDVSGNASGNAATVTNGVYTTGNQTIGGTKTFSSTIAGAINGNAATVTSGVYLTGSQTLTDKTLTSPRIGTNILDTNGNELLVLTATGSAVNELTIANGATGNPASITASGETNIGVKIAGKGTGGVIISNATANGAFLEFDTKAAPADPSAEMARLYLKQVDANNNALACKIQKAGAIVEVQLTSPGAICGVCGGRDGAKDPTYDFARSMMLLELYCGHSYEVPMTNWTRVA